MEKVFQGFEGVLCYTDDILVSSKDEASHFQFLGKVLTLLEEHNFHLKQEKCNSLLSSCQILRSSKSVVTEYSRF